VVLVQKKGKASEVGEFKPISVMNSLVKILSKVLANKLRDVLREFIGEHQTGFSKDRCILESIANA